MEQTKQFAVGDRVRVTINGLIGTVTRPYPLGCYVQYDDGQKYRDGYPVSVQPEWVSWRFVKKPEDPQPVIDCATVTPDWCVALAQRSIETDQKEADAQAQRDRAIATDLRDFLVRLGIPSLAIEFDGPDCCVDTPHGGLRFVSAEFGTRMVYGYCSCNEPMLSSVVSDSSDIGRELRYQSHDLPDPRPTLCQQCRRKSAWRIGDRLEALIREMIAQ